jgi:ElaB/YqjD/DUF883 family membrane-anchored ribosome-binding protein
MESSDFTTSATNAGSNEGMGNAASNTSGSNDSTDQNGLADKASGMLGNAKDRLGDVGSTVRDRASTAKDSLANALQSGAEKLRQRAGGDGMSAAGADGGSVAVADDRMTQVTSKVAGGMEATADWLRDADLDSLKASVERQVKDHPGRTLLIAVGVGYLLGKALKK